VAPPGNRSTPPVSKALDGFARIPSNPGNSGDAAGSEARTGGDARGPDGKLDVVALLRHVLGAVPTVQVGGNAGGAAGASADAGANATDEGDDAPPRANGSAAAASNADDHPTEHDDAGVEVDAAANGSAVAEDDPAQAEGAVNGRTEGQVGDSADSDESDDSADSETGTGVTVDVDG